VVPAVSDVASDALILYGRALNSEQLNIEGKPKGHSNGLYYTERRLEYPTGAVAATYLRQLCAQETKAESRHKSHQAKERGKPKIVPLPVIGGRTGNNGEKRQPSLDRAFPFDGPARKPTCM
jgi:hypothetical protein